MTTTPERSIHGTTRGPGRGPLARYLADSRNALNTIMLLVPVFVIYSVGILTTGGVRNGVDLASDLLRGQVFGGNDWHYFLFNIAVAVLFVLVAFTLRGKQSFNPRIYLLVLAESTVYGLLLGTAIGTLLVNLGLSPRMAAGVAFGPWDSFVLSLGAGLWEELVFRLLLLGGLALALIKVLGMRPFAAWTLCILLSSLVFSAIHYTGNMADTFTLYSFMFRFLAGVIFALIFKLRGLAVAVYTHAVYDIMVMVL